MITIELFSIEFQKGIGFASTTQHDWIKQSKTKTNKTFNKRKNRALLTLGRSQKHNEIFSTNVLRENITWKQFKRWFGLVSISQTNLRYLVIRTQSKY